MTLADAIAAHDEALTYGGRKGIGSLDLIESALGRPYSGYHRPINRKAAALLESMVGNHGFTDGNKRTAWLVVELLIERSGYYLNIPDDDPIDDIVVGVAESSVSFDDLTVWFKERLKRAET
ncbi:type II toxin-antitoxin system death-on-curing family toxin [Parasedimentitalea marina]|uniref:type II toxin-antitoxin system death-on-curing family toxin n=1 Tax=Parasedimentitalea marina TaxID=2483033 RepID=UPI0013E36364|nr:type II toxin-antitoxin system death-on-curing family toxin [Parasedimentitalea marina]